MTKNELKKIIADAVKEDILTEAEAKILHLRLGLDGERPKTLEEVGAVFKITRERIRQIEAKAERKLKNNFRDKVNNDTFTNLEESVNKLTEAPSERAAALQAHRAGIDARVNAELEEKQAQVNEILTGIEELKPRIAELLETIVDCNVYKIRIKIFNYINNRIAFDPQIDSNDRINMKVRCDGEEVYIKYKTSPTADPANLTIEGKPEAYRNGDYVYTNYINTWKNFIDSFADYEEFIYKQVDEATGNTVELIDEGLNEDVEEPVKEIPDEAETIAPPEEVEGPAEEVEITTANCIGEVIKSSYDRIANLNGIILTLNDSCAGSCDETKEIINDMIQDEMMYIGMLQKALANVDGRANAILTPEDDFDEEEVLDLVR